MLMEATTSENVRYYRFDDRDETYELWQDPDTGDGIFVHRPCGWSSNDDMHRIVVAKEKLWWFGDMIVQAISHVDQQRQQGKTNAITVRVSIDPYMDIQLALIRGQEIMTIDSNGFPPANDKISIPLKIWEQMHGELRHISEKDISLLHDWEREIYLPQMRPHNILAVNDEQRPLADVLLAPRQ